MKTLFRILGTAAAVAVTGAAIVALDKILNQKDPLHVEEVEFPEEAEQDASEEKSVYDPEAPNPNPVEAGPAVAPKDENGKFDATKIADASDFGDWEEQGCKG